MHSDVSIIASGVKVSAALQAAEKLQTCGINARVVDTFTIKPIDEEMVIECATKPGAIVTAENYSIIGGLGSAAAEVLAKHRPCVMHRIGVDEKLGQVGTMKYLAKEYKMTSDDIVDACLDVIQRRMECDALKAMTSDILKVYSYGYLKGLARISFETALLFNTLRDFC